MVRKSIVNKIIHKIIELLKKYSIMVGGLAYGKN
tara:strand:- start:223 stop:324 length:102 start_codon:yes stop_codon:yes gene_type:complete